MSNLRRYFKGGDTVFLTNVTFERRPFLVEHIDLFRNALTTVQSEDSFAITAWVVLPDHFHIIAESKSINPSLLLRRIKLSFSTNLRKRLGVKTGRIWQYRFWDHIIRDQEDLNRHIDYIHYNPVKHGLMQKPTDWPHSSIHEYIKDGFYAFDWGMKENVEIDRAFGE